MPQGKAPRPSGVRVSLTVLQGLPEQVRYQVDTFPAVLGSWPDSEVHLPSPEVSEAQARLSWVGGNLYLEDLAQSGTTRVNDQAIGRVRLGNGDIIELGPVKLLLQLSSPSGRAAVEAEDSGLKSAWLAGFTDEVRRWFREDLAAELGLRLESFRTGEEVLIALSRALESRQPPALIILDLRLPMINGINIAIAARAFELGYRRQKLIPLAFIFDPPEAGSFEKVVKFCQPLSAFRPGGTEMELMELVRNLTTKVGITLS